jgi:S1-C subfamily serine protease
MQLAEHAGPPCTCPAADRPVVDVVFAGRGSNSGVGFAIPIDTVKGLVNQILQYGRVMRPSLGVVIAPPQALQRTGFKGVLVLDVSDKTELMQVYCQL